MSTMSSDDDGVQLMAAFKKKAGLNPSAAPHRTSTPRRVVSIGSTPAPIAFTPINKAPKKRKLAYVHVSPVRNKEDYTYYEPKDEVEGIIRDYLRRGEMRYEVRLWGDKTKEISFEELLDLPGGPEALQRLQPDDDPNETSPSADEDSMRLRRGAGRSKSNGFVDISTIALSSSDEVEELDSDEPKPRGRRTRTLAARGADGGRSSRSNRGAGFIELSTSEEDSHNGDPKRRGRPKKRKVPREPTRRSTRQPMPVLAYDDEDDEDDSTAGSSESDIMQSDILPGRKRKRNGRSSKPEKIPRMGMRQSDRATRATNNMQDPGLGDVFRSDSEPRVAAQKLTVTREIFATLPRSDLFRSRHAEGCEVCYNGPNIAPLIYCQGCSLAYHKNCLGNRSTRDHLVTKVGDGNFVLQCKRCINFYKKKDATAPDLSRCQDCSHPGASCQPFRRRKTTQQEMKDREENEGQDPIVHIAPALINNAHNVLFRCTKCSRAWHYHHLPPISQYAMDVNRDEEEMAEERFLEYSNKWLCKECDDTQDQKVGGIIAWRPSDVETYQPGTPCDLVSEDDKQYLLKWENQSYFRAAWFSGAWTWGVTAAAMRKAFFKREDGPKMRTEDAIPEEYLRIDIVLDIKYTSYVEVRSEEIDKARIKEVDKALIKYKGLGYEDSVWEKVPTAEDGDRWLDFVTAYNDWVAARYIRYPKQGPLKMRLEKARNTPFAKLEREKQPENLVGGELMKYQIEGLNWLYYQWYSQKNGILADEMGLGKTIQVIAFLATLIQEHNCFPFLIVVPNSTCANWRREIKQWAPSLRVVAYFGSAQARNMAHKYEMFPEGAKELRCHIVVTSYEAAADDSCRRFFRSVSWAGMIIDEGQRLKNDKSQLYTALTAVRSPFRLLLTGTPLQNNARELFNLLHFLDDSIDAAALEEKYAEMTSENVKELHDQIRPFILRRTKAQVLTFLPPLGQVILPISMSHLQKQLYKSILSKNPELLKALFTSAQSLKQQERANLSNILMQLRKCLCHPFVYSREIEERTDVAAVSHRNLVEASAKLSLLELLLPKLQERGHRALIFSQFLDMLDIIEDFLDGMQLPYQRLDGTMGSLEKQKRIDQFNAPDSPLFAFLLSTRAGGVGINLATADTVIILDPDWNPHQDLQAIARAHRIGQKKKVLCLQLTTRASVEEKIMQMGRKKMALDHVVVEQLDTEDIEDHDVESILKFGAAELFKDDADHDIRYDDASIEKLLDRSQIENTKTGDDNSAESQFSFARIWAQDKGGLQDDFDAVDEEVAPDPGVWDKILKERQAAAAAEALARAEAMGRGRRAKAAVDYATETGGVNSTSAQDDDPLEDSLALPSPVEKSTKRKPNHDSESDTDFQAPSNESEASEVEADARSCSLDPDEHRRSATAKPTNGAGASPQTFPGGTLSVKAPPPRGGTMVELQSRSKGTKAAMQVPVSVPAFVPGVTETELKTPTQKLAQINVRTHRPQPHGAYPTQHPNHPSPHKTHSSTAVKPFVRATIPLRNPLEPTYNNPQSRPCPACHKLHPTGACDLKAAGVEHCGLCGLAHYGHSRTCPHIKSETQVRAMLEALKNSPEKKELVDAAMKYLRGVKGTLVQQKKKDREKALAAKGVPLPGASTVSAGGSAGAVPMPTGAPRPPQMQGYWQPPVPGSVGAVLAGNLSAQQQRAMQMQAQGLNDQQVESALRGFLGGGIE
ncbi:hypothetical protein T440DRAFT_425702 [Plenodomus tracheiphilus IPT5]|uniref:Uncharacterized protein n=1 Tax=Plenodomus tracheiphilus IPT5 TaxID=1408161 RepID=A0A6A7B624_9PLEO|nr:hypothetical protein T440DRAFT_425702 [Plenodomus tracheiphilus IPT5]